jgi:SAM-dependent methyltransferase
MTNLDEQKAFYDSRWTAAQRPNSLQTERCAAILSEVARLELKEPRILDFGCGTGWLTSILSHFGNAEGVDLSAASAIERFPHLRFYEADLNTWNPEIGAFDLIVSQEVIEHFEVQARFVETVANLLKPGGWLVLTTPNRPTTNACPPEWRKTWLSQPVENIVDYAELKRLLAPRFRVMRSTSISLGYGRQGSYRLANSAKLAKALTVVGLQTFWEDILRELGYGLHLVITAKRT